MLSGSDVSVRANPDAVIGPGSTGSPFAIRVASMPHYRDARKCSTRAVSSSPWLTDFVADSAADAVGARVGEGSTAGALAA
jgi:hypothetical protein